VIVYAESSAVLAWILGDEGAEESRAALQRAERVVSSRLTLAECERALVRARVGSRLDAASAQAAWRLLATAVPAWSVAEVTADILREAGRPFPHEPIRTLDAIHLATASFLRTALPDVRLLTLDDRLRVNAALLGFEVLPRAG
jgi:predicted nucleic acid-binding protein